MFLLCIHSNSLYKLDDTFCTEAEDLICSLCQRRFEQEGIRKSSLNKVV